MSNSLDPDQARRIVGPDLGPNCLPRLSADDTGRQRVNLGSLHFDSRETRQWGMYRRNEAASRRVNGRF